MATPIFVYYTQDSARHNLLVLELANRLIAAGLDVMLDRYELPPGTGWESWVEAQLERAETTLVVCSERLKGRLADGTLPGVRALSAAVRDDGRRVIPVLLEADEPRRVVPPLLTEERAFRFPDEQEALLRTLTQTPPAPRAKRTRSIGRDLPTFALDGPPAPAPPASGAAAPERRKVRSFHGAADGDDGAAAATREAIDELRALWEKEKLAVVAGAGVSLDAGLPSWDKLLEKLLFHFVERTYETRSEDQLRRLQDDLDRHLSNLPPIVHAQFIRSFFQDDEEGFVELVHTALYAGVDGEPEPGPVCRAIAELAKRVENVVTFNYDDLLERALLAAGERCTAVCSPDDWAAAPERHVKVFHPHGYLPWKRQPGRRYPVILAESDYHTQYFGPHLWNNVAVSRVLFEKTCLFVGTSLTDPNLRRLLDAAHREQPEKRHYFLVRRELGDVEPTARQAIEEVMTASYQGLGVEPVWFDDFSDVPRLLDDVRRLA